MLQNRGSGKILPPKKRRRWPLRVGFHHNVRNVGITGNFMEDWRYLDGEMQRDCTEEDASYAAASSPSSQVCSG